MIFDWFTVGAQALNFLILVWLMKRFLYKPILKAIDAREKRIAAELADADEKRAEAEAERGEFRKKNEDIDRRRADLLGRAKEEAAAERHRLVEEARKAAEALSAKRRETMKSDARSLNDAIARRAQEEVLAIARKALSDLAGASLEERLAEAFTSRLREMDGGAKKRFGKALETASEPAVVRSAFELPKEQRKAIQEAIKETFSAEAPVRFETAPELIGGIELTTNGQKVAWSLANYLTSLEKGIEELVGAGPRTEKDEGDAEPEAKSR